jgi:hypothetical protein
MSHHEWLGIYVRASDGVSINLTETDTLDLSFLHQLCQNGDGLLDSRGGVLSGTFEEVDRLGAPERLQAVVDAATDVGLGTVGLQFTDFESTLDAEDDFVGLLWVLGEVFAEQMAGVVVRSAVKLSAVPAVGAEFEGGVQSLKAYFLGRKLSIPGQPYIISPIDG